MAEDILEDVEESVTISFKIPKKLLDKLDGKPLLLLNLETGEVIPGGLVVNEAKALATPCHGYDLGEGKKMLWSKGVIGTLSLPEQERFCQAGMDIKPATGALARRIKALREAGVKFA